MDLSLVHTRPQNYILTALSLRRSSVYLASHLPMPDTVILVESGTAFMGISTLNSSLNSDFSLKSMKNAWVLCCGTPSGTTSNVLSMASPATGDRAVTLILIGPVFVGVMRKETGVPSFDLIGMFFVRDASISVHWNLFYETELLGALYSVMVRILLGVSWTSFDGSE